MHEEILSPEQLRLLPSLEVFFKKFGLVGGTAIALHLGHRRSIDFDLFTNKRFQNQSIRNLLKATANIDAVLFDEADQYSVVVQGVRLTFLFYPFPLKFSEGFKKHLRLPSVLTLAAMKAYALGRRAKWKDYVDLFFILKSFHTMEQINRKAKSMFKAEYNEKIFRTQLAYLEDIDYSEAVDFLQGHEVNEATIKKELLQWSLS